MKSISKWIMFLGAVLLIGCSDENESEFIPVNPPTEEPEPEPAPEPTPKKDFYIGSLVGFEGDLRKGTKNFENGVTTYYNRSLFEKVTTTEDEWWDNLVEEIAYSGMDYAAMNCRGTQADLAKHKIDHGRPDLLPDMIAAMERRGVADKFKIAIFDDCPASWSAARNEALGYGYSSKPKKNGVRVSESYFPLIDIDLLTLEGKERFEKEVFYYIWDRNLRLAMANIPDKYLFKYNDRPLIYLWGCNGFLVDDLINEKLADGSLTCTAGKSKSSDVDAYHGKLAYILQRISESCQSEFGMKPFLVIDQSWCDRDQTIAFSEYVDGINNWFGVPKTLWSPDKKAEAMTKTYQVREHRGLKVGTGIPGFLVDDKNYDKIKEEGDKYEGYMFLDADHGKQLKKALNYFRQEKVQLIFLEGFTDVAENTAYWRSSDKVYYDYPNQRLNILRQYSNDPYPAVQKLEAEACDYCYASGSTGGGNAISEGVVSKCSDTSYGGGWSVGLGTKVNNVKWKELPFRKGESTLKIRYSADREAKVLFKVNGENCGTEKKLPATYNNWETVVIAVFEQKTEALQDMIFTVSSGAIDLNYIEIVSQ